jgi:hypothetical protein
MRIVLSIRSRLYMSILTQQGNRIEGSALLQLTTRPLKCAAGPVGLSLHISSCDRVTAYCKPTVNTSHSVLTGTAATDGALICVSNRLSISWHFCSCTRSLCTRPNCAMSSRAHQEEEEDSHALLNAGVLLEVLWLGPLARKHWLLRNAVGLWQIRIVQAAQHLDRVRLFLIAHKPVRSFLRGQPGRSPVIIAQE